MVGSLVGVVLLALGIVYALNRTRGGVALTNQQRTTMAIVSFEAKSIIRFILGI